MLQEVIKTTLYYREIIIKEQSSSQKQIFYDSLYFSVSEHFHITVYDHYNHINYKESIQIYSV